MMMITGRNAAECLRPLQRLHTVKAWCSAVDRVNAFDDRALASAKLFEEIPAAMHLPFMGTAWEYLPIIGRYDLLRQNETMADKRKRFGKIYREKLWDLSVVVSFNPDDMQTIFNHEGPYPTRGGFESLKVYRESRKQWYSTTGVMILEGKEWYDLRSKTQKHLMKPRAIQAFLYPVQDIARDLVTKIYEVRDSKKEVSQFLEELYKWAVESAALVGLDTRLNCLKSDQRPDSDGLKMVKSVKDMFHGISQLDKLSRNPQFWKLFPTPAWKKFCSAGDTFTEIAFKYINQSKEKLKCGNEDKNLTLLQSMLMTKGLETSGAMVTVADMILAGMETTAHTVGFFLYHMARNPEKQEVLYQEVKRLLPNKEDRITPEIFNELRYLKACMKESHRLTPIVSAVARMFDEDFILSGYRVPAGTLVLMGLHEIYLEENYFSNPRQFFPERWLQKEDKFHPFAFVPFGIGRRSCIGRRMTELLAVCLVTELLRNFKIDYHYEDITLHSKLMLETNHPDQPLRYSFIDRL